MTVDMSIMTASATISPICFTRAIPVKTTEEKTLEKDEAETEACDHDEQRKSKIGRMTSMEAKLALVSPPPPA